MLWLAVGVKSACVSGISSLVDGAVRKSLKPVTAGQRLTDRVAAGSQRVLLHAIAFRPAERTGESQLTSMRDKYPPLNAAAPPAPPAPTSNATPGKQGERHFYFSPKGVDVCILKHECLSMMLVFFCCSFARLLHVFYPLQIKFSLILAFKKSFDVKSSFYLFKMTPRFL